MKRKIIFLAFIVLSGLALRAQFGPPVRFDSVVTNGPMAVGDLTNDGLPDVVVSVVSTPGNNYLAWYKNLGNGNFSQQKNIDGFFRIRQIELADFNNDGFLDVVTFDENGFSFYWFKNLQNDSIDSRRFMRSIPSNLRIDASNHPFEIGDLNSDGNPDLVVCDDGAYGITHYYIMAVQNINNGSSWGSTFLPNSSGDGSLAIGDISGDSLADVLSYSRAGHNGGAFEWYRRTGNYTFTNKILIEPNVSGGFMEIADLDMDSDKDIAVRRGNAMQWYENSGSGTFTKHNLTGTFGSGEIAIADLNSDGKLDILYHASQWYENLGGGSFAPVKQIAAATGAGITKARAADFDADGDLDFIYTSVSKQELGYMENFLATDFEYTGIAFYDFNQNKVFDSADYGFENIRLNIKPDTAAIFSSKGQFKFITNPGVHTISFDSLPNWHLTTDSLTYTRTVGFGNFVEDSLDFGFYWDTAITRLEADLIGSFPRCNRIVNFWIDIRNQGTTAPSGIIELELDSALSMYSSSIAPDSVLGQVFYFHFDSLRYFGRKRIKFMVQMPSALATGDTIVSWLTVRELDQGLPVYEKRDSLTQIIACAYDPNAKYSFIGEGKSGYVLAGSDLEYAVHFQNTGNDTAFYVQIVDQLDTNLDWNSFQPLFASHENLTVQLSNEGLLTYTFDPIILPDSNINEAESHGQFSYRIRAKSTLVRGTEIHNSAEIFFDLNPGILTDTTINTVYDCKEKPGFAVNNMTLCQDDTLTAIASAYFNEPDYTWDINAFVQVSDSILTWKADTAGIFNLQLQVSNSLCIVDSAISILVHPKYDLVNTSDICQGDSLFIAGQYRYVSGLFVDSMQSALFCDSIVSTTLNVNSVYDFTQSLSVCQDDSILIFGTYQSRVGAYYDSLTTAKGCDSVYTVFLSIDPKYRYHTDSEICEGDSILIFGNFQDRQGIYYDSLQTIKGCDSVFSNFLLLRNTYDVKLPEVDVCLGDSIEVFGQFQSQAGIYYDTLLTQYGCDSILQVEVAKISVDTQLSLQERTYQVSSNLDSVVWINCDSFRIVQGETDSSFTPVENGSYAAIVYQNGCSDTTTCIPISIIGINESTFSGQLRIYPNPSADLVTIDLGTSYQQIELSLLSISGQLVQRYFFQNSQELKLNLASAATGNYLVMVRADGEITSFKLTLGE